MDRSIPHRPPKRTACLLVSGMMRGMDGTMRKVEKARTAGRSGTSVCSNHVLFASIKGSICSEDARAVVGIQVAKLQKKTRRIPLVKSSIRKICICYLLQLMRNIHLWEKRERELVRKWYLVRACEWVTMSETEGEWGKERMRRIEIYIQTDRQVREREKRKLVIIKSTN